jgi:hypothetical protein
MKKIEGGVDCGNIRFQQGPDEMEEKRFSNLYRKY